MRFGFLLISLLGLGACVSDQEIWNDSLYETLGSYEAPGSERIFLGAYYSEIESTISVTYNNSGAGSPTAQVVATNLPKSKRYLYLRKSSFLYSDKANFKTDDLGLLSSTDVTSTQDLGTALNDMVTIAKAATRFALADVPQKCNAFIELKFADVAKGKPIELGKCGVYVLPQPASTTSAYVDDVCNGKDFPGFCAYEPIPVKISIVASASEPYTSLAVPTVVPMYQFRHWINPKRDFLTSPHDTYQMNNGAIVAHNYTSDSQLKGFFGIVTTPVSSALGK